MLSSVFSTIFETCRQMTDGVPHSTAGQFWFLVKTFWHDHWLLISLGLIALVVHEIVTRGGSSHYNSRNGFSPGFNRIVGSGTYLLLQGFLYLIFSRIFGDGVYCYIWPLPIHAVVFALTGWLLRKSGFWVY